MAQRFALLQISAPFLITDHKKLQESLTEKRKGAADMKMSRAVSDEQEIFYRNRKKYACQKIH